MSAEGNVHPASYRDENGNIAPENREKWWKAMEGKSKERFVEIETLNILKERMGQCYERAGNCCFSVSLRFRSESPGGM